MSARTFGVEIECGNPQGREFVEQLLRKSDTPDWGKNVGADGSGVEIRSPILGGNEGFDQIKYVMDLLTENGTFVTKRDGMHTHYGAEDFLGQKELITRLVRSWHANHKQIHKMVAPYRRASGMCREYDEATIKIIEDHDGVHSRYNPPGIGRRSLNISNLSPQGKKTVEVRLFQGCLNPAEAIAWIKFCRGFIDSVAERKRVLATCASVEDLLARVGTPAEAAQHLSTVRPVDPPDYNAAVHGRGDQFRINPLPLQV